MGWKGLWVQVNWWLQSTGLLHIQSSSTFDLVYNNGSLYIFIRLESRLQPNIGFTLRHVLAVFTHSAITPPKVNRFGWNLEHSEFTVGGWRDPCSSDSWRARRNFLSGKQPTISPISRRPNFMKFEQNMLIGVAMKTFGTELWKFYHQGSFTKKCKKIIKNL